MISFWRRRRLRRQMDTALILANQCAIMQGLVHALAQQKNPDRETVQIVKNMTRQISNSGERILKISRDVVAWAEDTK